MTRVDAGWLLAASLVAAVAVRALLAGRRRTLLNEALHELRRPLQALALATAPGIAEAGKVDLSLQVARALERLDREINGGALPVRRDPVAIDPLLEAAVRRWRGRAAAAGVTLRSREPCTEATLSADPDAISRALDNLIVNAIEHGGPLVLVGADLVPPLLSLSVVDRGRSEPVSGRLRSVGGSLAPDRRRLVGLFAGRGRRGHGLRVVERVAAEHGGEFRLRRREDGAEAVVALPLAVGGAR